MKFAVESWSADYGAPIGEDALVESAAQVDIGVECAAEAWAPVSMADRSIERIEDLLFVDGVRRVEANVWITDDGGEVHQGFCASYAAGAVRCNGSARVVGAEVRRGLFSPTVDAAPIHTKHADFALHTVAPDDDLPIKLQQRMFELEEHIAARVRAEDGTIELTVVDGPLKLGQNDPAYVGYIKTHHRSYGPPVVREVITKLAVGQRTPLLLVGDNRFHRYTWYLRLPCTVAHGWAGIVRLETSADQPAAQASLVADRVSVTLPRFASAAQKDPRAPQNLYPIGGLERELRRRLGDQLLILRSLRAAAAA